MSFEEFVNRRTDCAGHAKRHAGRDGILFTDDPHNHDVREVYRLGDGFPCSEPTTKVTQAGADVFLFGEGQIGHGCTKNR